MSTFYIAEAALQGIFQVRCQDRKRYQNRYRELISKGFVASEGMQSPLLHWKIR
jgi:hypothetical protein